VIPEIAHFALIFSLVLGFALLFCSGFGVYRASEKCLLWVKPLVITQGFCLLCSFLGLVAAFVCNDFTVKYVSEHSNTLLPVWFRIAAVWGGHEGSILLWALVLSGWMCAVSLCSASLPEATVSLVLGVMQAILIGFLLFILLTSNPFVRMLPHFPMDGSDLNPLLQDIGLILHPPILYMGYVGFSVVFAFAIAGLITGKLDSAWAKWSRPWTITAWAFLSVGIALGSWWAYYELGWGGWWFWDPVENASFMPWLAGSALLHSLAATEKRGVFKAWTIFLAILAFSLSLLGTFLVRSGILTSVHAFATDPTRGTFILIFLFVVIGVSFSLFAWRAPLFKSEGQYTFFSRESMIFFNNLALMVSVCVVFLGTLFPLIAELVGIGKISVGPPYFNFLIVPIALFLACLLTFAPFVKWKQNDMRVVVKKLAVQFGVGGVAALIIGFSWYGQDFFKTSFVLWIVIVAILAAFYDITQKARAFNEGWLRGFMRLNRSYIGMQWAHIGFLVSVIGVAMTSFHSVEKNMKMAVNDRVEIADYEIIFDTFGETNEKNYLARRGVFSIYQNQSFVARLAPEKRVYTVQKNVMTEASIDAGFLRDIYIALGDRFPDGSWSVRLQVKPYMRWVWLGAIFMAIGVIFVLSDSRYRSRRRIKS